MLFHVSCDLEYTAQFPTTIILNVHAQRNASQTIIDEQFVVKPSVRISEFTPDGSDNRFIRLKTGRHKKLAITYAAAVECDFQTYSARAIAATPVAELNGATIPYLFPSRYCQSDQLSRLAWDLFGAIENPHEQVLALAETSSTCAAAPTR
jgi:hypothetical protein